jgi:hypothetical protein
LPAAAPVTYTVAQPISRPEDSTLSPTFQAGGHRRSIRWTRARSCCTVERWGFNTEKRTLETIAGSLCCCKMRTLIKFWCAT